jgi:hypothetical protein
MADRKKVLELVNKHLYHLENNFDDFCNVNDSNIVSHAEKFHEGIIFNIHLTEEYYLIIFSENQKVKKFEIYNRYIHKCLTDAETSILFNL